jgi:hypothetical protein
MSVKVSYAGGSGLVGKALQIVVQDEKRQDEDWIFVGSKDANLWYVSYKVSANIL